MMNTPVYTMEIPSTGQKVKFRPFLVKEEKALLIAQSSEDASVMVDTLKSVIKSCVQDKVDVDLLAIFDLEYMFTQLRAKSVGEEVSLLFPCDVCDDEKAEIKISFDLTQIKVSKPEDHNKNISLFGDVGVVMRYPTIDSIKKFDGLNKADLNSVFDIIADSIEYIYQGDELFYAKEQEKTELLEFLGNLTSEQFSKVQRFFETMPKLQQKVDYNCPVCGLKHEKVLEGLESFF